MDTLHEDLLTFMIYCWILLRMCYVSAEIVQKIETHILYSKTFFSPKIVPLWEVGKKYGRAGQDTDEK